MGPVSTYVLDKILPSLSVGLIGTFSGAGLAFWSKRKMDAHDQIKSYQASANYAMFVLQRQVNELICIERDLNPWRTGPDVDWRWIAIRAQKQFAELPALHLEDLAWTIEELDPNLLSRFMVARDKCLAVRGTLDLRGQSHQRALDEIDAKTRRVTYVGDPPSLKRLASELPGRLASELVFYTDQLFELTEEAIHFNAALAGELHKAFREVWPDPKIRIIRLEPLAELLKREQLELPCHSSTASTA
ncbi:MAG: hypothetical protein KGL39_58150 [Patescibacteria group bacterium]|nr:hypothetical protein [Patescibacteria group bacterium]